MQFINFVFTLKIRAVRACSLSLAHFFTFESASSTWTGKLSSFASSCSKESVDVELKNQDFLLSGVPSLLFVLYYRTPGFPNPERCLGDLSPSREPWRDFSQLSAVALGCLIQSASDRLPLAFLPCPLALEALPRAGGPQWIFLSTF